MNWQDVCDRKELRNLPYKIETNEYGQLVMTPVKVYHSAYQGEVSRSLPRHGKILSECAIKTRKGTKVADIAWTSEERFEIIKHETECSIAPEICVEVLSVSNTTNEIDEKKELYFENSAVEVWICKRNGSMTFFDKSGKLKRSSLVPDFPNKIEL